MKTIEQAKHELQFCREKTFALQMLNVGDASEHDLIMLNQITIMDALIILLDKVTEKVA